MLKNSRTSRKTAYSVDYQKFIFENLSVIRPPLLKIYFWELYDIEGLNQKLLSNEQIIDHTLYSIENTVDSIPIKTIFWLRNLSNKPLNLTLKRKKNCNCVLKQTRVGFNQFRQLFKDCLHRQLVTFLQDNIYMEPNDLVALSMTINFMYLGVNKLSYEIRTSDHRVINLDIMVKTVYFQPENCILTKELIPVDIKEMRRFVQPIWVRNIRNTPLCCSFSVCDRRLLVINPNLKVPPKSIWPILVQFRAVDYENDMELNMLYYEMKATENIAPDNLPLVQCKKSKCTISISGRGMNVVPDNDIKLPPENECADNTNIVYPNQVKFEINGINQIRSQMLAVQNVGKTNWEYRWQDYKIDNLFGITFEPNTFRLKPGHTKLCVMILNTSKHIMHFKRIPLVLEVHRILDKSTKVAQELLDEVTSIDNPKWCQGSYFEHVFVQLDIQVNYPKLKPKACCDYVPFEDPLLYIKGRDHYGLSKFANTTLFEKIFWDELACSNFMRKNEKQSIRDDLTYDEVLALKTNKSETIVVQTLDDGVIVRVLAELLAETLRDISKNWTFIPLQYVCSE